MPSKPHMLLIATFLVCAMSSGAAEALNPEHTEFFESRIRPVLNDKCVSCHGAEKQKGGLRLDSLQALLAGGDSGASVVPGDADASHLIVAVRYQDEDLKMPPKNPLTKAQTTDLEKWVSLGAPWPGAEAATAPVKRVREITDEDRRHWSFLPLRDVKARSLDELAAASAPRADKRTLLRRVYFDLIGLPPAPEQVAAFLADDSPGALEKVVDELLRSPHYGERWARHWLDLVRFAESNGHNRDPDKPNMWRYRDYVIQAFNDDLPYDAFLREQIAGDLLPPRPMADGKTNARMAATGLWWSYELVYNPAEPAEQRADQVDTQLDIFGKGFLGLSIACARCHDHKTDPILTRDYYALAGIFHSTKGVQRPAVLSGETPPMPVAKKMPPADATSVREARLAEIRRAKDYMLASAPLIALDGNDAQREAEKIAKEQRLNPVVLRGWVSFLKLNSTPCNPNVGPWLQIISHPPEQFRDAVAAIVKTKDNGALGDKPYNPLTISALTAPDTTSREVLAAKYQAIMLEVFQAQREDDPVHHQWLNWFRRADTPYTESVFAPQTGGKATAQSAGEKAPGPITAMACAESDDPRFEVYQVHLNQYPDFWSLPRDPAVGDVPVHIRGQVGSYGELAPRGFLTVLPGGGPAQIREGSGRRELAAWLTGPAAPLAARVMVNRLWQHHFGAGIVATPNDFGKTGTAPTQPDLLDFLAAKFIESGWSLKAMHKLIVTSAAYQQDNRIRRLEAEAVRDAILAVSGSLDARLHGPGVTPHITEFMYPRFRPQSGPLDGAGRRSIYLTVRRNFLTPMLSAFDFPNPSEPVGKRETSNVPTQALTMLNNEFIHEQARRWGEHVAKEPGSDEQRIAAMFERALGRQPDAEELAAMLAFAQSEPDSAKRWADLAHALFNTKDFIFIR